MNRDWLDFKSLHSNIAGARQAFENACETLFKKVYPNDHVSQVSVKVGDGGIDIFVGELGIKPITVIQCKFFLESFDEIQKRQIRESFETAVNSEKYELETWILCIPRVIDIEENSWWFKWKHKKIKELSKDDTFIKLLNGNELINLLKTHQLYDLVFSIEDSIKIAEIHNALIPQKNTCQYINNPNEILFNNYNKKYERYYSEREVDKNFIKLLSINNVWVYGKSGKGKTALVNRNLIKKDIEYCFCDLSPINVTDSNVVLEEIICKIEEKFPVERNIKISNKIKQIAYILHELNKNEIIIVIDELSVKDTKLLKVIADDLCNLVIHYSNSYTNSSLKFVVSTIFNPKDIIDNISKASGYFEYLDCNDWDLEIGKLFDILTIELGLEINTHKYEILNTCENSPRILKSIIRKVFTANDLSITTINQAIKSTYSELVK